LRSTPCIHSGGMIVKNLRSAKHRALMAAIVAARQSAGLTQRQLAAKLKRSNSFVWKIEAGERRVEVLEFVEIARATGVDPADLLTRAVRAAG
jgi:transcriptional regulator with XRE-family HTH domain